MRLKHVIAGLSTVVLISVALLAVQPVNSQNVDPGKRQIIKCFVNASTGTSLAAFGGDCAAPGATQSIYITDIVVAASAASTTSADAAFTLKYGTGGTCGSGTTSFFATGNAANAAVPVHLMTPIKIPKNNEVCWIHSVAGTKWLYVAGYIEKG